MSDDKNTEYIRNVFATVSAHTANTLSAERCVEIEVQLAEVFDRWLNEQLDAAWDAGATAGFDNAGLPTPQWVSNPYRKADS